MANNTVRDSFKTAYNAKQAIVENRPFSETNREEFEKLKDPPPHCCIEESQREYLHNLPSFPRVAAPEYSAEMVTETYPEVPESINSLNQSTSDVFVSPKTIGIPYGTVFA